MQKIYLGLFWLALLQLPISGKAQNLENLLQSYPNNLATERVSLQLSETVIGAGKNLWFQAIINNSDTAQELSRVVYVEVFNQQRVAVAHGIYQASTGVTTGQLTLPDSLVGGWYQLRAYTQYMLNAGSNAYYTQPILIISTSIANPSPLAPRSQTGFTLYPAAGNWIAEKENSVVAQFRTSESYSDTARLEIIRATDSAVVARTSVLHSLEEFKFTPQADTSYLARFIDTDTSYLQITPAKTDSYTVEASIDGSHLEISVTQPLTASRAFVAVRSGTHLLHFQAIAQPTFSTSLSISQEHHLIEVAILNNQEGILAQRLLYRERPTDRSIISLSKTSASPREELRVSLDGSVDLNEATLAFTVRKGHISRHPLSVAALDHAGLAGVSLPEELSDEQALPWINQWLVTQTSPWPSWMDMLAQKSAAEDFMLEDEMLLITGRVQTSQPIEEDDRVLLSVPGDDPYFEYSGITEDGQFAIPVSRVYGSQRSILQFNPASGELPQNAKWEMDDTFAPPPSDKFYPPYTIRNETWQQLTDAYQLRKRIQQKYYGFEEDVEDTLAKSRKQFRFYGAPNMQIDPDDYIDLPSFEEICRELLPGVRLTKKKDVYDFDIFNPGSRKFLPNEPTLLLDGVPIQDKEYIINFPPDQIDFIETVNRRTYYGNVRLDGVIAIYTKQAKAYEDALSEQAHFITPPYYTPIIPFSSSDSLATSLPDFQTLLYWKPNITFRSNEPPAFTFTTSDELGSYEVIVQGTTKLGVPIYERATFEVQPVDLP